MLGTLLCIYGLVEFLVGVYVRFFKTNAFIRFLMITQIFTLGVKNVEISDATGFKRYISASFALSGAFYITLGAADIKYNLSIWVIFAIILTIELFVFKVVNKGMKEYLD
ncbi:MAG: hypothetical protein RR620_05525 [Clostridium sp.]